MIESLIQWFSDPAQWSGSGSIPFNLGYHLLYSAIAMAISLAIAFPLGVFVGHTGKGQSAALGIANIARALPTVGLLILLVMAFSPLISSRLAFVVPTIIVLVLLAVPPILNGVVQGIHAINPSVIEAARGMGLTGWQLIAQVEIPCAMPLIFSGARSALLQVISTASVAAYVSLNGFGRYIIDGRATGDYTEMLAGALLMAALAIVIDLLISAISTLLTSPGVRHESESAA